MSASDEVMPDTVGDSAVVHEQLSRFFEGALATSACVRDLRRTSVGLSCENWAFDLFRVAGNGQEPEPLILRRDPVGSLLDTDRMTEGRLLAALEATPLPTPRVLWADVAGEHFDRPALIMARERGSCDYLVLNGASSLPTRRALAHRFCDLLAALHLTDWRALRLGDVLEDPGPRAALVALETWSETLRTRVDGAHPELTAASMWLRERAPASSRSVLVHGDFKPGNALVEGDDVVALLDWETAHVGDPLEDLGWVTQPLRSREHQIPGVWEAEQIVERYEAKVGFAVERSALQWWRLFAAFKTAIIQLTGLTEFLRGRSDRMFREPAPFLRLLVNEMDAAGRLQ